MDKNAGNLKQKKIGDWWPKKLINIDSRLIST